ncbi:MAG: hypothetical protein J2P35_15095, partial [Actinobacteria bacterium]|nr:hypothetical protein [Actinomycetota bacterium]
GALLAAVPLSLSMGAAEWSMLRYRQRTQRLLRTIREPRQFGRKARQHLLAALLTYLAAALLLTGGAVGVAAVSGRVSPEPAVLAEVGTYLLLGTALFLVLMQQTFRVRALPLAAAAAALAAEIVLRGHGMTVQIAASAALLAVAGAGAAVTLSQSVRHAY